MLAFLTTTFGLWALTEAAQPSDFHYGMSSFILPNGIWPEVTSLYAGGEYKQAVFLSFDGMHQFDLIRMITEFPESNFAALVKNGIMYSHASASSPSDSLPATASIFTGAAPRTHGIFWEQMFDRSLFTGGTDCAGPIGGVCDYSEAADLNNTLLDGGNAFNLTYLPHRRTAWGSCQPVLPHNFLRTNTVFEVARGNGLWTAFADKHLSYEFVNGPSGTGLSEGYFPEIASVGNTLEAQQAWDDLHWSALFNWTNGNFLNGTRNPVGGPSIYAANFQAITWAQQNAGYLNGRGTPNTTLAKAFKMADERLGSFLSVLKAAGRLDSTLLLVGSKQGQGPVNPQLLKVSDPTTVMDGAGVPVAFFNGEDGGIASIATLALLAMTDLVKMYLEDSADAETAKANLLRNVSLGISYVLAGDEVQAAGFGSPRLDPRVPDLIIGAKAGTLWNEGFEFEDHGGFLPQDLHVPLIAYNPAIRERNVVEEVSSRQIASTMLQALGLPVSQLDGYASGEAPVLPGIFRSYY